jgi:hypothetical protein
MGVHRAVARLSLRGTVSERDDHPDHRTGATPEAERREEHEWGDSAVPRSLVELVNRVLDRGVVLQGEVTISVAGVDLVYLGLNALLTSVSTARRTLERPVGGTLAGQQPLRSLPAPSSPPPESEPSPTGTAGAAEPPPPPPPPPASFADAAGDALATKLVEVADAMPSRVEVDPEGVQQDLGRLVLTIVELLRQVVEHQAMRRMEDDDLSEEQVERMGLALLRLEEKMQEIKAVFGLADEELNIDLGPLGKLL